MSSLLPTARLLPEQLLAHIERQALAGQALLPQPIFGRIDALAWHRVIGLGRFWQPEERGAVMRACEDVLVGLHGAGATTALLIHTFSGELSVLVGVQSDRTAELTTMLHGCLPGIQLAPDPTKHGEQIRALGGFAFGGQLTGVPTLKSAARAEADGQPQIIPFTRQIERVVKGMHSNRWGYFVRGEPLDYGQVLGWSAQTLELIKAYDAQASMGQAVREGLTIQGDRAARRCVEALEQLYARLELGKTVGMWAAEALYFAAHEPAARQLTGLLNAAFSGHASRPEPLRVRLYAQNGQKAPPDWRQTLLHTGELATLSQLPVDEAPGYEVRDYAPFDLALPRYRPDEGATFRIGEVLDGATPTGQDFTLPRDHLASHGIVAGVTGSGKTNTCFSLLKAIWQEGAGQPFLVIEPAKTEYRALHKVVPGLRIYTVGDERFAPLRLNPFEFECVDAARRIHVQTHIDYLKSLFNAAFVLYAPMPYVLETCLHEIYTDRGWNLTTGTVERRLPGQHRGAEAHYPVFPTLHDLYVKIEPVVDRLGYDERISRDVKAGLKARIGSLMLGGKGLMLNTRTSLSIARLLAHPTILELERVGNDDEKAFIIGLLLARIYEYRVVEGQGQHQQGAQLKHVLLIEEAHRLLQNVATSQDAESANPRGKAVETFTNILAEIRAYGQGLLIAEQIPGKLAPDAIKNTNLKVLHRMVAADERRVMAGAMNLDELQERAIVALGDGEAAVFAKGADRPYLLRIERMKGQGGLAATSLPDNALRGWMAQLEAFDPAIYRPRPGCEHCRLWQSDPRRCATVRDLALTTVDRQPFQEATRRYVRALADTPAEAVDGFQPVLLQVRQAIRPGDDRELREVTLCALVHAAGNQLDALGIAAEIPYPALEELHKALLVVLAPVAQVFRNDQATLAELSVKVAGLAQHYGEQLRVATARPVGPYPGCAFCRQRCAYGHDLAPLARDPALQREVLRAIEQSEDDDLLWRHLAVLSRDAARRAAGGSTGVAPIPAALCFAAQVGPALGFGAETQLKLTRNIHKVLTNA